MKTTYIAYMTATIITSGNDYDCMELSGDKDGITVENLVFALLAITIILILVYALSRYYKNK